MDELANGYAQRSFVTWFDHGQEIPAIIPIEENALPDELRELAKLLPTFEGDFLESQLQTFDLFLPSPPEKARWQMMRLFNDAIAETKNTDTKLRLRKAVAALQFSKPICKPYNHAQEMKKYQEEFKKIFPDAKFAEEPEDPK